MLETLLLKGALGLSDEDISHFNGLFYARDTAEALAMVRSGRVRRRLPDAPHARGAGPRRRGGRREHAAEVDLLLPKLLTGLLFNPLRIALAPISTRCPAGAGV